MKLTIKLVVLSSILSLHLNAQLIGDLKTGKISELDAIQTPKSTFIAASMELFKSGGHGYRVLIHRSVDNGKSWNLIDSLESHDKYVTIGDPVLSVDKNGKIYFLR